MKKIIATLLLIVTSNSIAFGSGLRNVEIIEGWSDGKDNVHTRYVVSNSELIAKCLF